MSDYYRYLKLPTFLDQEKVTEQYSKNFDATRNKQWRIDTGNPPLFTNEAYDWLKQFGCDIGVVEIFYTAPHSKIGWHTDVSGYSPVFDYVKINFVWGSDEGHYMKWGKTKDPNHVQQIGYNAVGSPHILFKQDEIVETESVTIKQPILVNVGVPHCAVNNSDVGRWCVCLIPKKNGNRLNFNEAIDLFGDYVI